MAEVAIFSFVGSTVLGAVEAKKREKRVNAAQERERATAQAIRQNQARVATRKQIREARVQAAAVESRALASGQGGSSAAISAQSSLTAQLGTNVGTIQTAQAEQGIKERRALDVFKAGQKSDLERAAGVSQQISGQALSLGL